jgi:hypothetical protein
MAKAKIDPASASLPRPTVSGVPRIGAPAAGQISFLSPPPPPRTSGATGPFDPISATGRVDIVGTPGESVAGWRLGWFQLQFIEDNYARYRGRTERDGSAMASWSHLQLSRDTDETATPRSLYYDPPSQGVTDGRGTFTVGPGTVLPASGRLTMTSGFGDGPESSWDVKVTNTKTRPRAADNFLHHADIAFHFCTLLVAESPTHEFTFLKHFYWNIRWEAHFKPNASGVPTTTHVDHVQLNVQREVHSGVPSDRRFAGRQLDARLPISNDMDTGHPRFHLSVDWGDQWVWSGLMP